MAPRSPSLSEGGYALISDFSAYLAKHDLAPLLQCLELRVFGSIAKGASTPTDFDVAIVYRVREYSAATRLRRWVRENSDRIQDAIGMCLNLLVLSEAEFLEAEDTIGPTVLLPASY